MALPQIALIVLTVGTWLLIPLSIWLWRRGRRRLAAVSSGAFVLVIVVLAAAIASGGSSSPAPTTSSQSSEKMTNAAKAAADTKAQASIARALKSIASNYQDFHTYGLVTPVMLGNLNHQLRGIPSLAATGHGKRFSVSIRSASGTTFTVRGVGLKLQRTCSPAGRGCPNGHWRGAAVLKLPKVPVVTAAEKARVRKILTASVDHYARLFSEDKQALGTTQYATATAGVAAFNDPNSAASRFSDYRKTSKVESDLSFLDAFKRADSVYTAANEPKSISGWRNHMLALTTCPAYRGCERLRLYPALL